MAKLMMVPRLFIGRGHNVNGDARNQQSSDARATSTHRRSELCRGDFGQRVGQSDEVDFLQMIHYLMSDCGQMARPRLFQPRETRAGEYRNLSAAVFLGTNAFNESSAGKPVENSRQSAICNGNVIGQFAHP